MVGFVSGVYVREDERSMLASDTCDEGAGDVCAETGRGGSRRCGGDDGMEGVGEVCTLDSCA